MNRISFLFILVAFIFSCNSEPKFVVKGNIEGSDSIMFHLMKRVNGKAVTIDSALSKKGVFKLEGKVEYPDMVQLVAMNTTSRTSFYIENSQITITGKLDSLFDAKITGSKTQDEYQAFIDANKPLTDRYSDLYTEYQSARQSQDMAKVMQLEREAEAIQDGLTAIRKDFVRSHTASFIVPAILNSLSIDMNAFEIEAIINAMDTNVAKTPIIKDLTARVMVMKTVEVGQKAPDFTLNDVNGKPVSLSSKIGAKLLLVDFWAAWCGPCRQENPNLVADYKQFHKKGFEVFGVSLDQNREDWVKAIADDNLTWTHVSDLQYWNNAAAKLYSVKAIPANFLIDETGTIIARNLRGNDLTNKLLEILGN